MTPEELAETAYIVVNEDGLRMPCDGNDSVLARKFIENPVQVGSVDDLYDLMEMNIGNPTKYVLVAKGADMKIQNKILRKCFYENSVAFDDMVIFAEVTSGRMQRKLNLKEGELMVVQNKNDYSSIGEPFNFLNLELEKKVLTELSESTIKE